MVDQSPHIIAKVAWDTKCSDKALAVSLQNEISHWTKTRMASEITQVLDNLCPADQVWKIESLELDLGTIDYADLTGTLSNRFSHTLTDQLRSLLFYTIRDKAKIKVTKIADSNLLLLKNYLEKGYLPWWQKQQITSVKNIFENLFKNDRQSLMQMIRAVGRSHHVRTRLAQQFEDGILQKIIAELEPYHSKDIFSLLNGLVKVQSRERIVSSSTSHFRKNVWSWVFTHLLVEQDRHFNDVAFVKSLLNQMATQFHLDYHGLVLQVSTLPKTRKSKKHVHPGLITAVDQLLEGRSVSPLKTEESENWQLLNQYFDTSSVEKVSVQHMSELLTTLSDKEPHKMRAWLSQLKKNTKKWVRLSDSLDERTFSSVLSSIYSKDAQLLIHGLRLLKKVIKEDNWSNNKKLIWRLGLDYAMHSNQSKNQQSLVEFFINTMAENENIAVEGIFDGFRRSNVWSMPKTKHSLNLFEDLQATQQNKNGVFNSEVFSQRIRIELDRIRKANYRAEVAFEEYQQLSRWVIRHTKLTSETLKEYFDTVVLPKKFLENLSSPALEALLNQVAKQHKGIISEFEAQWEKMMQENQTIGSFPLTLFTIRSSSIRILIKDRFVSNEAFIKALINELTHFMSIAELTIFQRFIHESLVNGDKTAFNFSTVEVSQIKKLIDEKTTEDFLIKTHVLISQGSSDHDVVSAFLLSNYEHPDFVNARNAESEDLSLILNYFIQDGTRLKKIWTQKALETLKTEVKNLGTARVSYDLRELFWKCALFYKDHWGDATLLKRSFDQSIASFYNRKPSLVRFQQAAASKPIKLSSGGKPSFDDLKAAIINGLNQSKETFQYGRKEYSLTECIENLAVSGLEELANVFAKVPFSKARANILITGIEFGNFALCAQAHLKYRRGFEALRSLYLLIDSQRADLLNTSFLHPIWQQAWAVLQNEAIDFPSFAHLVRSAILEIQPPEERDLVVIVRSIQKHAIPVNAVLKEALIQISEVFELLPDPVQRTTKTEAILKCEDLDQLEPLFDDIFKNKSVPAWFNTSSTHAPKETINELLDHHPVIFLQKAKENLNTAGDITWLAKQLDVSILIKSIELTHPALSNRLKLIYEMHTAFKSFSTGGLPLNLIGQAIKHKILVAWTSDHWELLSSENIWNELIWEVCTKQGVDEAKFRSEVNDHIEIFPSGLQLSFKKSRQENEHPKSNESEQSQSLKPNESPVAGEKSSVIKDQIMIQNAGIVILANYINMLFDRLRLLDGNEFKDQQSRQKAVHYLQYVATGLSHTEESLLVLNKVICGLRPDTPIIDGIDISAQDKELVNGLINAVIGYWPTIGKTSIDGFRGNWLVREGLLTEDIDRWDLSVDKRAYDLLIQRSPFSFSIIKYPWMEKPLHVTWPY